MRKPSHAELEAQLRAIDLAYTAALIVEAGVGHYQDHRARQHEHGPTCKALRLALTQAQIAYAEGFRDHQPSPTRRN